MLADYLRLIAGELQRVGLQGPNKEAPTSHRIPRINNEPSQPTEGVRFCLSRRSAPFYRESLFESNNHRNEVQVIRDSVWQSCCWPHVQERALGSLSCTFVVHGHLLNLQSSK